MSRIAKEPVMIPQGIEVTVDGRNVCVKSKKAQLVHRLHPLVTATVEKDRVLIGVRDDSRDANMQSGTARALIHNMVLGLEKGFEKRLLLVGVGFRAQAQGKKLNLVLGFSHPVVYELPDGVVAETPSQTEIILKSSDKGLLGQVAANIRAFRAPEPYKGKGIRYADEVVRLKETKKK